MELNKISGSLKAAILIQAMGKETIDSILNRLTDNQRALLDRLLSDLDTVPPAVVEKVAREFVELAMRAKSNRKQSANKIEDRSNGKKAEKTAEELDGIQTIQSLNADELFELIKDEHPQTIAVIMIHLKTEIASEVMSKLPDEIKSDVALRIANLDKVASGMVEEINSAFNEILKDKKTSVAETTGGVDRLAEILNQVDEISSELILSEIEEANAEMASQIKQKMFVFEDLTLVDDRGIQNLLRRIETTELATALKAASEEVKEKIFNNMSERAGEMLREEIEDLGPVRMKEVTDAQQNITNIIQEMETKGEIIISGRRGEEIIT